MASRIIDLTGLVFHKWTVIKIAGRNKTGHTTWYCECECGTNGVIPGHDLKRGKTKSCGCLRKGRNAHNWTGNNASYAAVHRWLIKNKPKPFFCERCRERLPRQLSYNHTQDGKTWSRNPDDYEWLCIICHNLKDRGMGGRPLTRARIDRIREFYATGAATQEGLGKLFKVTHRTISNIVNKRNAYKNI